MSNPKKDVSKTVIAGLTAIAIGLLFGVFYSVLSQGITLLILTPMVLGFGASILISATIWFTPLHGRTASVAIALLMSITAYASFRGFGYWEYQQNLRRIVTQNNPTLSQAEQDAIWEKALKEQPDLTGFVGYLKHLTNSGMFVRSTISVGPPQQVNGIGLVVFLAADLVGLFLMPAYLAHHANSRKFCQHCQHYYGNLGALGVTGEYGLEHLGAIPSNHVKKFILLLRTDDCEEAGHLLERKTNIAQFNVYAELCPTCETNPISLVVKQKTGSNGVVIPVANTNLAYAQYERVLNSSNIPVVYTSPIRWLANYGFAFLLFAALLLVGSIAFKN